MNYRLLDVLSDLRRVLERGVELAVHTERVRGGAGRGARAGRPRRAVGGRLEVYRPPLDADI